MPKSDSDLLLRFGDLATGVMTHRTFIGLHIPKCAGTSLLERARSALPDDQVYQCTSIVRNYREKKYEFMEILDKQSLSFVWGHWVHEEMLRFFGPSAVLITGLREPIARFRSEISYLVRLSDEQGQPPPNLEAQIASVRNPMCWFLITRFPTIAGDSGSPADRAMNVINACHYVYFSENFDQTAGAIFDAMGIKPDLLVSNVADGAPLPPILINPDLHRFDIEMYERAREKFINASPIDAFSGTNPMVEAFLNSSSSEFALREFLWESAFQEYTSWNVMAQVIQQKRLQSKMITDEIAFYERKILAAASGT